MGDVTIERVDDAAGFAVVAQLMTEYVAWLPFELCFQDFDAEVARLPEMFGPPGGAAYVARLEGIQAGVVGYRALDEGIAELKRMWVRPVARGHRIGRLLAERAIGDAAATGFRAMRLDTVAPAMGGAIDLYESLGFVDIEPYYGNPLDGARFMELSLATWRAAAPSQ